MTADSNLRMGNAQILEIEDDTVHFAAERHDSPKAMWFGFRILGAMGKVITCVWEHTDEILGEGTIDATVPVCKSARALTFKRVSPATCHFEREHHRFTFSVPCE